ncbi:Ribosome recycling factor [hydrothermal vent metagenome]|uniref:Ribosome recycling factor n=1 Tax=hydrothermal vent metagenome TaxID=652676 RepID=A0A3B0RLL2_9ZZZZ
MSVTEVLSTANKRMDKAIEAFQGALVKLRTGRASVAMLDHITIDYYGNSTPLNQVANLSVPEPRSITVQPWDVSQIGDIERAIISSDLGLTPGNDGKLIRINIPQLTEERRKELVKLARKYGEDCKVAIRNCRRDANDGLKKLEKDKEISQDEQKKAEKQVQEITDKETLSVDAILAQKEKEIMEV